MAEFTEDVRRALARSEFHPYFQPFVLLRTGELHGFEILARWQHPFKGLIPPDNFIPAAERDGWIDLLTAELLRKALSAPILRDSHLSLAINISPHQLHNSDLPGLIERAAEATQFSPTRLIIEITENAILENIDHARSIVLALKTIGCKLSLDDFGTGYSSLLHLKSLPFDELKVDRSFVTSMLQQRESRKIVAAVVGLGQSLGLTTVAEGVETAEQAEMLRWLGCELGQGWLFGRPMPVELLSEAESSVRKALSLSFSADIPGRDSLRSLDTLPTQRLAQLQAVYDGAPVGLGFLDRDMRYRSLNRRLADINGAPMVAHLGRTVSEMVPDVFPKVEPYLRRALRGEAVTGIEVTKPPTGNHGERDVLLSYEPARDEAGEVVGISVALVDISALKKAELARRETEEHFRHMIELLPQIPWIIDAQGRALDVSQRWLDITGMTDEQWRGFGWLEALHPDDLQPTIDAMGVSFKTGCPIDLEYRVRRPHQDWIRLRARGAARIGDDGNILCWYGCLEIADK